MATSTCETREPVLASLPAHVEWELNLLGVVRVSKHAPVHIPEPKPRVAAWKPTYPGEEPPF